MAVGVAVAVVGVAGSVAAALIGTVGGTTGTTSTSMTSGPEPKSKSSRPVDRSVKVSNISFVQRLSGSVDVIARGRVRGLRKGEAVYVVARVRPAQDAQADGGSSAQTWLVQRARSAGKGGAWRATIRINTLDTVSVFAVQMAVQYSKTVPCGYCDPRVPEDLARTALEASGPDAPGALARSKPLRGRVESR